MSNVKLVRLLSGEELLTEVVVQEKTIEIKNPVRVMVVPSKTDPNTPSIGLAPWAEFSDEKVFTIDKFHVVVIMNPVEEFVNQYKQMFGGIITNKPKLILPG